ncbi:Transposon protein [Arachis hypogaea]|nr:Transposon protein [Arachis hypogaea]
MLFFNKFITWNNSFIQFVKQYDNCLGSKEQRERERESDAADFHTVIPCTTKFSIEAQFQHVYTLEKFKKVQAQFKENVKCITRSKHSALGYTVYEVVEQIFNSTFNKSAVTYDTSKNVKRRHTHIKSSHDEPQLEPKSKIFDELVFRSQNIYEFASESEELAAILYRAYDNVMVEMQELKVKSKGACSLSHEDANLEAINELQSPPRVRTRGRPKNRSGSKMEKQIANASKKKKTKALSKIKVMFFK